MIKFSRQRGYGLIETIACLGLTGILATGACTFVIQTITESARTDNHMQATMQVENAGYWVSRDVQMAENLTLGEEAGFPLQLVWVDIDRNVYQVTYNVTEGRIKRSLIENDEWATQTLIAENINAAPSLTHLSYTDGLLVFDVTSTCANVDVSRTYQIKKRLDLK
jgi:type II secretory pathway component PulJ